MGPAQPWNRVPVRLAAKTPLAHLTGTAALPLLRHYEAAFAESVSVLPDQPDESAAEAWLRRVRERFWTAGAAA